MANTIQYFTKSVYGVNTLYLTGIDAFNWCQLTGKKTINAEDMHYMMEMFGVTFERVFEPAKAVA